MRGTFVKFPDEGTVWVDFKYEFLPRYCLICGIFGHATRFCQELQMDRRTDEDGMGDIDDTPAFRRLEAETDIRGKPLGSNSRSKASVGSNGGRKSGGRWRKERIEDKDGNRRSSRSSLDSGTRDLAQTKDQSILSGEESVARWEEEVVDTASLPSKSRAFSTLKGSGGKSLAGEIRCQRMKEEEARRAMEAAFDAGLIGPGGVMAEEARHIILKELPEHDDRLYEASKPKESGIGIDLNVELQIADTTEGDVVNGRGRQNQQGSENDVTKDMETMEDDPFELTPIIEAVMRETKGKKRQFQDVEHEDTGEVWVQKMSKQRLILLSDAEETSREGSPRNP
ncbi:hypothetical protein TB1_009489 [Malus domestica]